MNTAMDISIFEVVGPKMMGPSSSATAGMSRIGRAARSFLEGDIRSIDLRFVPAWENCYYARASHVALIGGMLGIREDDPKLRDSLALAHEQGIGMTYSIFGDPVPLSLLTAGITAETKTGDGCYVVGTSVGGASVTINQVDGFPTALSETEAYVFVWANTDRSKDLQALLPRAQVHAESKDGRWLLYATAPNPLPDGILANARAMPDVTKATFFPPLLSLGYVPHTPLFTNFAQLLKLSEETGKSIAELAIDYEINRSGRTRQEIWDQMADYWQAMKESVRNGLEEDIVPVYGGGFENDGKKIMKAYREGKTLGGSILPKAIAIAIAVKETGYACNIVVATPTAGSCGIVPGCLLPVQEEHKLSEEKMVEALFVAAAMGVVPYYYNVSFSGSFGGCQGEVGVGSAMTAGALVYLGGGDSDSIIQGATLALKHILGLICDAIPGRAGIPCSKRGGIGVANAFAGADMALSGVRSFIPPDEVIASLAHLQKTIFQGPVLKMKASGENVGAAWTPTGRRAGVLQKEQVKGELLPKKK